MEFLYNKTPKVELYNIRALIISGVSTNNAELVKVNGYGTIAANDESENNVYIVHFVSVLYKLQVYVESDGNQLESGERFCNEIFTSPGRHTSPFMSIHVKDKNCDCVNEDSCY